MSELARRALNALPRLSGQSTPVRAEEVGPVLVEIRAAEDLLERFSAEATDELTNHLRRLRRELGLDARLELRTVSAPVGDPDIAISIGRRPVALISADAVAHSDRPAGLLCHHALHGTLRRLPLLVDAERTAGVAPYVVGIGCALPRERVSPEWDVESAEKLIEQLMPDEIVIEVPPETMRRVDEAGRRAVADLRVVEFRTRGIRYPDVRVRVVDGMPGNVTMRFNNVTLPPVALPDDADWQYVVNRLGEQLATRRHWFVRVSQVRRTLTQDMDYLFPELVSAARGAFSLEEITACLRELLRSGRRIRNMPRILWLMLEQGDAHGESDMLRLSESPLTPRGGQAPGIGRDPVVLAARVRKIANEEAWRMGSFTMPPHIRRLDARLEELLVGADGGGAGAAEWEVVHALAADPEGERIVTRTIEAIGPVRDAVQALGRPPRVMASQELPPDIDLDQFAVIGERV